jgi:threonine dehydratase
MATLTYAEIEAAVARIGDRTRRVVVAQADQDVVSAGDAGERSEVYLALEFMQHTGTFKARGALNFIRAERDAGSLPEAGVTVASGGNAGLACAWAARDQGVLATVFVPATAPQVKIMRLKSYGADAWSPRNTPRRSTPARTSPRRPAPSRLTPTITP